MNTLLRFLVLVPLAAVAVAGLAATPAPSAVSARYPAQVFGPVTVLNQHDPRYQASMTSLAQASALLAQAAAAVRAARQQFPVPGFDYQKLTQDITAVNTQLNLVLVPRTLRLRYHTFIPDDAYFHPPGSLSSNAAPAAGIPVTLAPRTAPSDLKVTDLPPPSNQ